MKHFLTEWKCEAVLSNINLGLNLRFDRTLHIFLSLSPEMCVETLEKLAIPVLNLDVNHNGSGNCKLLEDSSTNEEATGADGASGLGVSSPANTGSTLRDSSPQPPGDAEDEGIGATGHSDQSASEDSSLTDSDRTLVGDVPDECLAQLSSPSNSPAGSDQHNVSSPEEGNTNTYHSFTRVSLYFDTWALCCSAHCNSCTRGHLHVNTIFILGADSDVG